MKIEWIGDFRIRILLVAALGVLATAILLGKLYFEQIRHGEQYSERVSRQSVRRIRVPARRGKIFTRDFKVLADNAAGTMIVFYPEEMRRPGRRSRTIDYIDQAAKAISSALGRENPLDREKIERHLKISPGLPLILFRGLTVEEAAPALVSARPFEGVGLEVDDSRCYPEGRLAAHVVGYTRRENANQADDRRNFFYYIPDLEGKSGMEFKFDTFAGIGSGTPPLGLRGIPGYAVVQVDIMGFIHDAELKRRDPVDGNHLVLTLDSKAQQLAEAALRGKRGAFVLLDAESGEVLAMASAPVYDLEKFTPTLPAAYYRQLLNDPGRPLMNRALNGSYTPGSIAKPLVAMALLEKGIDPKEKVNCTGRVAMGLGGTRCAARSGHGELDMEGALERSCNVYFINQAVKVGLLPLAGLFHSAGIGQKTGIELAENSGVLPSDAYKQRVFNARWNIFDTTQIAIGQGLILLTPLQAAVYTAAIANGGKILRPHLALSLVDQRGGTLWQNQPEIVGNLAVLPKNLNIVREGMFRVVNAPEGSGKRAKNNAVTLYGKTGSAEVGSRDNRWKNTWFIAFGTIKNRTYAVAMVVEEGVSGGSSCAPLVGEFFEKLFPPDEATSPAAP